MNPNRAITERLRDCQRRASLLRQDLLELGREAEREGQPTDHERLQALSSDAWRIQNGLELLREDRAGRKNVHLQRGFTGPGAYHTPNAEGLERDGHGVAPKHGIRTEAA